MPDDNVQVKFGADIGELNASMQSVQETVKQALDRMAAALEKLSDQSQKNAKEVSDSNKKMEESFKGVQEAISGTLEKIAAGAAGLVGILAGGKIFGDAIEATVKWDQEVGSLSHTLGISMRSASDLNAALRIVGISTGEYEAVLRTLERRLKTNEEGMNALGVATRDAQGQLLDGQTVMQNALAAMQEYKAGQDQLQFAQYAFGRGARDMTKFIELNAEAMQRGQQEAQRLGLEIGTAAYEATLKYEHELNNFHLVLDSLGHKIGTNLMPMLTEMAAHLNANLTEATDNAGVHVGQMHQQVDGLSESLKRAISWWDKFIAETSSAPNKYSLTGVPMAPGGEVGWEKGKGVTTAFGYSGPSAAAEQEKGPSISAGGGGGGGADEIALGSGTKSFQNPDKSAAGGLTDVMAQYQEQLNRLKDSQTDLNAWSTAQDYAFWNEKLAATKTGSDQWWAIWEKMADEYRSMSAEQQKLAEQSAKQQEALAKGAAAMQKSDSDTTIKIEEEKVNELYALGSISASQRFNQLQQLYNQQYTAELKAYYDELALLQQRGDATLAQQVKVWEEIEKAQNAHLLKMQKDENQYLNTEKQEWDKYASEVGNALTGMLFHHQTFLQTARRLEEQFFSLVIDTLLKKLVNSWLQSEAQKDIATQTGAATRAAAENTGFFSSILAKIGQQLASWLGFETSKTTATATGVTTRTTIQMAGAAAGQAAQSAADLLTINADAAVAAAGAYAATAQIPYVGPYLAPAAAMEAWAAVMAYAPAAALDVGAWEVPRDMLANIHKGEMVVPQPFAEGMRSGASGVGRSDGGDMHVTKPQFHFYGDNLANALKRSPKALYGAIQKGIRDNNIRWRR